MISGVAKTWSNDGEGFRIEKEEQNRLIISEWQKR